MSKVSAVLKLLKIEHSLFSLPLLFAGAVMGASGHPTATALVLVVIVGVSGRVVAMVLNRILDREIDRKNPRTAAREIPSGKVKVSEAWWLAAIFMVAYIWGCRSLGYWPLVLSPVPLLAFLLYPFLKRFTWLCHFGVGLCLALAALGGWVATSGKISPSPEILLIAGFVFLWSSSFDILYAIADYEFDTASGVFSIPARWGVKNGVAISRALHVAAWACLIPVALKGGAIGLVAMALITVLLILEATLVDRFDKLFVPVNASVSFLALVITLGVTRL